MNVYARITFALCCAVLVVSGCARANKELSKTQAQNRAVLAALDAIQTAYHEKDLDALENQLASEGGDVERIRSAVSRDFEAFASVSLQIWPDRIYINGSEVEVSCHWAGDWLSAGADRPIQREGNTTLTFTSDERPRLLRVVGDLPFGITVLKEPPRKRPL